MPRRTMFRSYQRADQVFVPRSFACEPPSKTRVRTLKVIKPVRVSVPPDGQLWALAREAARQNNFRERRQLKMEAIAKLGEQGKVVPEETSTYRIGNFQKFYRIIAPKLRRYNGRDAIAVDIYLHLKEVVQRARQQMWSLRLSQVKYEIRRFLDEREAMIVKIADEGELICRPGSPKDVRERGEPAYTEAAAKRRKDARRIDRITVRARLPGSSEDLFITLGRSTKKVNGRRVPCPRRIFAIQTDAEWRYWLKTRIRDKQGFRNYGSRRAQEAN